MRHLRAILVNIPAGFRAAKDLLLWGHVYPQSDPALMARLAATRAVRRSSE